SMISGAVTSPTDHIKGITDRNESEKWAQDLIKDARENTVQGKEHLALYTFANATDLDGELLPVETAAVELLNIIRPTVAFTVWVALIGYALFADINYYDDLIVVFYYFQDLFFYDQFSYYTIV